MTYAKLLEELKKLNPEQLDMAATIHIDDIDEYYGIHGFDFTDETKCDVLDDKHPVMFIR